MVLESTTRRTAGQAPYALEVTKPKRSLETASCGAYSARMTESDTAFGIGTEQAGDLQVLQRNALELQRKAEVATQAYERTAWMRYTAIWIPIPFVVLLFRLHMDTWHYYLAGGMFIAVGAAIYAMDFAAVAKRDKAIEMAERAQALYQEALVRSDIEQAEFHCRSYP